MKRIHLLNGVVVNEGTEKRLDLALEGPWISRIAEVGGLGGGASKELDLAGAWVLPGVVDTHVHFREPGMVHKASIGSESRAAIAGGVTSCMEMPNTLPPTTNKALLDDKLRIAHMSSMTNYAFYLGATPDNLDELCALPSGSICGVKVFMASSTGSLLVTDESLLERIFSQVPHLIALHAEDEQLIQRQLAMYQKRHGDAIPFSAHPDIRSRKACVRATKRALKLARACGTQLHVLHLSTADEVALFDTGAVRDKRCTAEAALPHLFFHKGDAHTQPEALKINPALKNKSDQSALWTALRADQIDLIGSDHAPHRWDEKKAPYSLCPSGTPLVQYGLLLLLAAVQKKRIRLTQLVQKTAHAPAIRYGIQKRGFVRTGYYADLVVVAPTKNARIQAIRSHCAWSPINTPFHHEIKYTFVSGHLAYDHGRIYDEKKGEQLTFIPLPMH